MEADLNKAITRAIQIGEAKAKAVEQRIAAHLKSSKRFLQVELSNSCEDAADKVFKIISGKRQKIADNYLSFKAYAVAAMDKITDYTAKGKGRNLSSIGDLLTTVGALSAVKAPKAEGLGMGGKILPPCSRAKTSRSRVLSLASTVSSTSTPLPLPRSAHAGPWVSASTSLTSSRSPWRARVSSRSTRCLARLATSCTSTVALSVSPTSSPTSPPSLPACRSTRLCSPSSPPSSLLAPRASPRRSPPSPRSGRVTKRSTITSSL